MNPRNLHIGLNVPLRSHRNQAVRLTIRLISVIFLNKWVLTGQLNGTKWDKVKKCSVCLNPNVRKINIQILNGDALREISERYLGISRSALQRHKACIPNFVNIPDPEEIKELTKVLPKRETHAGAVIDLRGTLQELHIAGNIVAQRAMAAIDDIPRDIYLPGLNLISQIIHRTIKSIHDSVAVKILDERFGREAEVLIRESITPEVLEQLPEGDYKT